MRAAREDASQTSAGKIANRSTSLWFGMFVPLPNDPDVNIDFMPKFDLRHASIEIRCAP
jgi:hypothetical protein